MRCRTIEQCIENAMDQGLLMVFSNSNSILDELKACVLAAKVCLPVLDQNTGSEREHCDHGLDFCW